MCVLTEMTAFISVFKRKEAGKEKTCNCNRYSTYSVINRFRERAYMLRKSK